ncbi:MAG: amino acid racemase [Firmicutes bacterium]|nr:amino acid racemase [Bacillota bacterium]
MKKLGIIGGMGPKATAIFFDRIVTQTQASTDQEHIESVVLNCSTIQDRSGGMFPTLKRLKKEVEHLQMLGVKNIVMPCNTAHIHHKKMQCGTKIKIINMIDETARYIKKLAGKRNATVGILATDTTIKTGLYSNALKLQGFNVIEPGHELQKKTMSIIYDQIKKTGTGNFKHFMSLVKKMTESGANYIVIGCTELSYFFENFDLPDYCIDAMEVLVKMSIIKSGKIYKGNY